MKTMRFFRTAAALLALGAAAGCDDLIVGGGSTVDGLAIETPGGATLVSVSGSQVDGAVQVPVAGQRSLVVVLRGPGGVVTPSLTETVRVTVTNPGVAAWEDGGGGAGVLRGVSAGATSMRVDLLRNASAIYTSPSIPVQVN